MLTLTLTSSFATRKSFKDGTVIYRFFKELLAYLKTLVLLQGKRSACGGAHGHPLQAYSGISDNKFHRKLAREIKTWCNSFLQVQEEVKTNSKGEPMQTPVQNGVDAAQFSSLLQWMMRTTKSPPLSPARHLPLAQRRSWLWPVLRLEQPLLWALLRTAKRSDGAFLAPL
jgi:hypothetical protein